MPTPSETTMDGALSRPDGLAAAEPGLRIRSMLNLLVTHFHRNWKIWTFFKVNAMLGLVQSAAQVILFLFVGKLIGHEGTLSVGGNYASFLIIGLVILQCLDKSLIGPFVSLSGAYWSARLETLMISPFPLEFFIMADTLWYNVLTMINVTVIVVAGLAFGAHFAMPASVGLALLTCLLAGMGVLGLGLISASLFSLINAKGQEEPISWAIHLMQGVVCGLYFPFGFLPRSIQALGLLLPHTYAIDSMRRLMIPGYGLAAATLPIHSLGGLSAVASNAVALLVTAILYLTLGVWLFRLGIRKAHEAGSLSRWT